MTTREALNARSQELAAQRAKATDPATRAAILAEINEIEDRLDRLAVEDAGGAI